MIENLAVKSLYPHKVIIELICCLYELQTHDMFENLAVNSLYAYKVTIELMCCHYELQTHNMHEILKSQLAPQQHARRECI